MASIIGVETLQHTNGTTAMTIDSNGLALPSVLNYRCAIFPATAPKQWNTLSDTDFSSNIGNAITATLSSSSGGLGHIADVTLGGLTNGIYEFHMFASHDRTSSSSEVDLRVQLLEGGTQIAQSISTSFTQKYANSSLNIIRDYTSSVPASVVLRWDVNRSNFASLKGNGFIIKRIG